MSGRFVGMWAARLAAIDPLSSGVVRLISGDVAVELAPAAVAQIAALHVARTAPTEVHDVVLAEDHPMWDHHSGGRRHDGPPLPEPGRLFTSFEIVEARGEVFRSVNAVAARERTPAGRPGRRDRERGG